jgi:hypothetical protein
LWSWPIITIQYSGFESVEFHLHTTSCPCSQWGKKVMRLKYNKNKDAWGNILFIISLVIWWKLTGLSGSHFSVSVVACHKSVLMLHIFILLQFHYFLVTPYKSPWCECNLKVWESELTFIRWRHTVAKMV